MTTNATKQGWALHPVRVLETAKETILSVIQRLSQVVSIEKLGSSASHPHLGCKVFKCVVFIRIKAILKLCSFNSESKSSCSKNIKANF